MMMLIYYQKLKLSSYSIPVCYFENSDKAQKFEDAVDYLRKWSAGKIKKYYETTYDNDKKSEEENEKSMKEHEEAAKGYPANLFDFYAKYLKKGASRYHYSAIYYRCVDIAPESVTDFYISYLFHSFKAGVPTK